MERVSASGWRFDSPPRSDATHLSNLSPAVERVLLPLVDPWQVNLSIGSVSYVVKFNVVDGHVGEFVTVLSIVSMQSATRSCSALTYGPPQS